MSCHCALRARRNFLLTTYYSLLLFEIARSYRYNLFNMTAFFCENPKHRIPEHRRANTPKGENTDKSWHQLPKLETEYYIILLSCHVILIYHIALIHHIILIYFVLISYTLITIIHHPGIISHHADIMSCWYIVWYHIIWYGCFNCWYNIIHLYRSHGNNLRYQNWYYLGIKRLPLNWKFLNLLLRLHIHTATLKKVFVFARILLSFAYCGVTSECCDPSMFWPFSFLSVTHYRPSAPLFGKIGHEMFNSIFYDLCKVWKWG